MVYEQELVCNGFLCSMSATYDGIMTMVVFLTILVVIVVILMLL